ncbi:cytochrome P450 [Didymella exigua CBS 183.55]|uniref:Cytochrome P450 n=1 Tax=Didymella exigua CBS 183.55 TaxID=1150837 RepID=A0A6A5R6I3_9PLEO|nr:cytochrome P450 [Didymella exigua CBS 183.55]KAF1922346.1 cytochrome P450 [Didymella exigua CBS 183.55]
MYYLCFHPLSKIPGPTLAAISPLWMMKSLYGKKLNRDIKALHDHYGDVVRVGPNTVSFATVGALSSVHHEKSGGDDGTFTKEGTIEWLLGLMTWPAQNILTKTDVKGHARLRKAVQPAFSAKELRKQEPIEQAWITKFNHLLDAAAKENAEINITEHMSHLVWDMLSDLAFGEPLARSQLVKFNRLKRLACAMSPMLEVMQSILTFPLVGAFTRWVVTSFPQVFQLPRDILPTGTLRTSRRTLDRTDRGHDFLSAIVGAEEKGIALSQEELQSNAAMLVMVGQDATVTCLSSTLYFLLRDPQHMANLKNEVRGHFKSEEEINVLAIAGLPLLNGSINEAMRLLSPANGTGTHRLSNGGFVEGIYIPPGITIAVDQYTIQRSPKYWRDPETYRPERWANVGEQGSEFENDLHSAYRPFLLGPRACLGRELALQIVRLVLARLVFSYDVCMANKNFVWERDCDSSYLWLGHKVVVKVEKRQSTH